MRIDGDIYFTEITVPFTGATITLRIEDVRRADASSVVIAEQRIVNVSRSPGDRDPVPFSMEYQATGDPASYSLRAHVDVGATGEVLPGDYISAQSYALADTGPPARLAVEVSPVG